ncbi:uncharacterized protein BUCNMO_168 [Buchnera aphidicola (Nipponaphis monzeni)]|uniref:Uncharacterized protein n=1 Tax=Buchnera aphidicola (Nipponaphis monzeni) TaxID=2495405 RepID=A0A455TA31_9GAMM|nr:uncharacterized protein BUCNMO_168 [Buchnera aphidicola (Nipponaphis monzeni)]
MYDNNAVTNYILCKILSITIFNILLYLNKEYVKMYHKTTNSHIIHISYNTKIVYKKFINNV